MAIETVSVVVPTFNRLPQLRRLLDGLAHQAEFVPPYEVIVVDDGSTDGTGAWLVSDDVPIGIVPLLRENGGPASARNEGIAAATGDVILFLDDDVVPAPDLVAVHPPHHQRGDGDRIVIGPMRTPRAEMSPWVRWEQVQLEKQYDAMVRGDWEATARQFYTGNASAPRRHLVDVGGFDVRFRRAEDVELAYRLEDAGLSFVFAPEALVVHYAERSFRSWRTTASEYGRNDVIFGQDQHRDWLFGSFLAEFHQRHRLVQHLTRLTLHRPRLRAGLIGAVAVAAQAVNRTGPPRLANAALSGLFNLEYYHGMASQLGGERALLEHLEAARPAEAR